MHRAKANSRARVRLISCAEGASAEMSSLAPYLSRESSPSATRKRTEVQSRSLGEHKPFLGLL